MSQPQYTEQQERKDEESQEKAAEDLLGMELHWFA
jgi:hypothetical protein